MSTYTIDGQAASADAFTRIACDPQRNIVVEACAGSGKTYLLVERMLRILANGSQPQEILAITFTKKAAGEMRERLMARLNEPRHHELYRRVLASGRAVDIRTFHSWFASLLRLSPQAVLDELGLPSEFELVEDNAELLAEVWPAFFEFVITSQSHLDAFNASVADLGRTVTMGALSQVLDKRSEFWAAESAGVVASSQPDWRVSHAEFAGEFDDVATALWQRAPYVELLDVAIQTLLKHKGKTPNKQGALAAEARAARSLPNLAAALLTLKGEPRQLGDDADVHAAQELLMAALKAMNAKAQCEHHQRMHLLGVALVRCYREVQIRLKRVDLQEVELAAKRLLTDPQLGGWMAEKLDARLSQVLIDEFQDTNPLQWQALSQWLSAYVGAGAGQAMGVFIVGDPKQSIYGFRGAQAGVFEAAKSFMAKQMGAQLLSTDNTRRCSAAVVSAINAALLPLAQLPMDDELHFGQFRLHSAQRAADGEANTTGQVICLPRIARPEVQRRAKPAAIDPSAEWDALRSSFEARAGQGDPTPAEVVRELELAQVANWISAQVRAGVPSGDIMVLGRTRKSVAGLGAQLRARGHAFVQHTERALAGTVEVQDVLALLDALASPAHQLSLARALKSPIFGWGDEALTQWALLARTNEPVSWLELLLNGEQQTQWMRRPEADLFTKTAQILRQFTNWANALPPHDALSRIYAHAGLSTSGADLPTRFACAAPAGLRDAVQSNLQTLLGATLDVNAGRFVSLYGLVRSLKRTGLKAASINAADAVVGMTIHAAKGLQSRIVVLVDADPHEKPPSFDGMRLDWPAQADAPKRLVFVRPSHRPEFLQDLLNRQVAQAQTEQINAWYVAMTRAVDTLVVSAGEPHHAGALRPWERMAAVVDTVAVVRRAVDAEIEIEPKTTADASFEVKIMPNMPLVTGFIDFSAINIEQHKHRAPSNTQLVGEAVHSLLQWFKPVGESESGWPSHAANAAGARHGLSADLAAQALQIAQRIVSGEASWVWDAEQLRHQVNELDLHWMGAPLRADRVVQHVDGCWWVLDFKTSMAHFESGDLGAKKALSNATAQARAQVATYAKAFSQSLASIEQNDATIKAALIWADGSLHEVDWKTY